MLLNLADLFWAVGTGLGAAVVLYAESHLARGWNRTQHLQQRPWNYVAGCATLLFFFALWGLATGQLLAVAVYALHLLCGGVAVFGAYRHHVRRERRRVGVVRQIEAEARRAA